MDRTARLLGPPAAALLALFALYAALSVPSLLPRWGASAGGGVLLAGWLALAALAWPISARERGRDFWPLLAGAAILLRLAALPLYLDRLPVGDPAVYPELARGLLRGDGLVFHDALMRTDFVALFPPAYPLLLAALGAIFGIGEGLFWTLNTGFDLAGAVLLCRIGAALGEGRGGRVAAWLLVIWPSFVLAAPLAQKESLTLLLVLAIAWRLVRLRGPATWRDGAWLGAATGLLALTQPGLALFPAVAGAALLPRTGWRTLWGAGWRAVPFALLLLAPWWVRNAVVLHHFVPLTSTSGIGLWIGNNPDATGSWMPMPAAWRGMAEIPLSQLAGETGRAWIAANPLDFAKLTATKLVRAMGVEQFAVLRLSLMKASPALPAALFPLCQGALLIVLAGAAGCAMRLRRLPGGAVPVLLVAACLAQIGLFGVWFEFGERHRYLLMPFLFLAMGVALAKPVSFHVDPLQPMLI